jgi:integrase
VGPAPVSAALQLVASVDELFGLDPVARFEALIAGPNFDAYLRAEPIRFDRVHPIYGNACDVPGCELHSTQSEWWCTRHGRSRREATRAGIGEAGWLATAVPIKAKDVRRPPTVALPACRFCPDRDATVGDLCRKHAARLAYVRRATGLDESTWAAAQVAYPGIGACRVKGCARRADFDEGLCVVHHRTWVSTGRPTGFEMDSWLLRRAEDAGPNVVFLQGLAPLVVAEIRYALWTHTRNSAPARWHPMWLRRLVKTCRERRVQSLLELDPNDRSWTPQPAAVNRIVREMLKDIQPIHRSRADTRELGYLDTNYWGVRFPDRRSAFDLTDIPQPWLRDLTWDFIASQLDSPSRPRTQGPFEATRRSIVSFGTYLTDCDPHRGDLPSALSESTGKDFANDLRARVANGQPVRGVVNADGTPSIATATTYPLVMNALRRVMRWAMDCGAASAVGLGREFTVAIPAGGARSVANPRPFTDPVLRALTDPANIRLLAGMDPHDIGLADIWSIQVHCGRRIGEVIKLRLDCVGEHLGRTWMWVDMTKVGKLDYAIQIPRHVYDLIRARQAKTIGRYGLRHGADPTAQQQRVIALFPSRIKNPTFERAVSPAAFSVKFRQWLALDAINLPGHTTHQARHTLATRLVSAGANLSQVKRVLGHISERMSESYVLIAGAQIEPFLQQVWVTGPGNTTPGTVVMTPTAADRDVAQRLLVDLAAIPTEHGLCTYKPVVGGADCPYERQCHSCEHFVLTGADYAYWKRQQERWSAMAEGAPDQSAREYIYEQFRRSSQALDGLEKALLALGLIDQANNLDLRSPHQDFFDPIWTHGWHASDLVQIGGGQTAHGERPELQQPGDDDLQIAS